jgi:aspartyl-tRNA(Asn)/glutamyl-tRNA(Gln) amidotransferase subunit B
MKPETLTQYEVVIGIETHVQLATKSKLFCGCDNDSREAEPNTHVCELCLGMPGTLPVLNKRAVELALRLGAVLNAEYPDRMHTKFDRKNYFYPDLPKGYQISQFDEPIVPNGWVEFPLQGKTMRVGITRAHLEEDAGKLTHPDGKDYSLVDLNRAGTPLLEIVSEPDMRSAAEAKAYAQELHNLVRYAGVSDANLYFGNMRFDVNVSVHEPGTPLGTRTETKNLNSFRNIEKAVEYEVKRQVEELEKGGRIKQETRGWNDAKQRTYSMRSKEDADEYRYFPEPDLPPLVITKAMRDEQSHFDLLPSDLRKKLSEAGVGQREAEVLVNDPLSAKLWLRTYGLDPKHAKFAFNWLIGDAVRLSEEKQEPVSESGISEATLAHLSTLVSDGKLSSTNAKKALEYLWGEGIGQGAGKDIAFGKLLEFIQEKGLLQESNEGELGAVVDEVIKQNDAAVKDYQSGNARALGALVGAAMKATKGKGNPPLINKLLKDRLG